MGRRPRGLSPAHGPSAQKRLGADRHACTRGPGLVVTGCSDQTVTELTAQKHILTEMRQELIVLSYQRTREAGGLA